MTATSDDTPWAFTTTPMSGLYVLTFYGHEAGTVSLLDEIPLRYHRVADMVHALNNPSER